LVTSTAGLYDAIATIYDEWQTWDAMTPFGRVAAAKLAPLLDGETRAARAGSDGPTLLDVGCGTGTMLLELRRARPAWRLAGIDASAGMLAAARAKQRPPNDVTWARASLGALPFARTFDVCTAFYDTLNHLPDAPSLGRAVAAARAVLRPGGLLAFDVTSRHGFEEWWESRNRFSGAGWSMLIDASFDAKTEIATADVTLERDGVTRQFEIQERYFGREEVRAALAATGFAVEQEEEWSPFPVGGLGKIWWTARAPE
jgi:SAM-dependent methyltransferase